MDLQYFKAIPGEKPLDQLKPDGGLFSVFSHVTVVGDSLSSGEMESFSEESGIGYNDYYEYSWGKYMERASGVQVQVFARGGMTALEYCESYANIKGYWNPDLASQAYIIALGCNDVVNQKMPVGSVEDINWSDPEQNRKTFIGQYARIMQKYRAIEPKARFFLLTMLKSGDPERDAYISMQREAIFRLAECFDYTYVLDLWQYAPEQTEEYRQLFYLGGHLSAAGYKLTSMMVMSYIDYIVRNNPDDFRQAAFIGRGGLHHNKYKW